MQTQPRQDTPDLHRNDVLTNMRPRYLFKKVFTETVHTSVVNKYISVKSIPEENDIILILEVNVSSCEEMRIKAERTE